MSAAAERRFGAGALLAGCGADPAEDIRAGRLLEELHSALAVLTLRLPPLRERVADLPMLVDRLLERSNAEGEARVKGLSPDAWDVVRDYHWPGNLRELYAVLSAARRHARDGPHNRRRPAGLPAVAANAGGDGRAGAGEDRCRSTPSWRKRSAG